jgi:hypothetical protein
MQLENQVTSLPLAQRLKSLDVVTPSIFFWRGVEGYEVAYSARAENHNEYSNAISAFTVAELGEMLQNASSSEDYVQLPSWHKKLRGYASPSTWLGKAVDEKTEADARAKMLIYLLENKLITL